MGAIIKTCWIDRVRVDVVREECVEYGTKEITKSDCLVPLIHKIVGHSEQEHGIVFYMDVKNRVKGFQVIAVGTLNAAIVHPREVFRAAVVAGAAGILFAHNHPSGCVQPSAEDHALTQKLKKAGETLGIRLMDHIVVGDSRNRKDYFSFADNGVLY